MAHIYYQRNRLKRSFRRSQHIITTLVTSVLITVMPVLPFLGSKAYAVADTTPPEPVSISLSSTDIDTSSTSVQVGIVGTMEDDLSGFSGAKIYYSSPTGIQITEAEIASTTTTSFGASVVFPRYAQAGEWKPTMTFADNSGNIIDYTATELSGLGFNVNVTVSSSPSDTAAPALSSLISERTFVDTAVTSDQNILVMTATDNLAGITSAHAKYTAPSGNNTVRADFSPTGNPDEFSANPIFGSHIEVGRWTLELTVVDAAGNTQLYDTSDLTGLSYPDGIDVTGDPDTTYPFIESLGFAPLGEYVQDVPNSGATFMLSGVVNDNLTGVAAAEVIYRSQETNQVSNSYSVYQGSGDAIERDFYIVTPPYAAEGLWLPELTTRDEAGNSHTYTNAELEGLGYELAVTLGQSVSGNVSSGGTVTTDTGTGATPTDPIQTAVTSPVAGSISVVRIDTDSPTTDNGGFNFFGTEYNISAPAASVEAPLVLTFVVDASQLDGLDAADVLVFRDGVVIDDCVSPNTADPDPCVKSRTVVSGGDVEVVVNTSHASNWAIGYELAPDAPYHFIKFKKPIKETPKLNKAKGGESIPVKFSVGGDYGLNILTTGSPTSQRINCNTKQLMGDDTPTESTGGGLKFKQDHFYRYNWKTLKKWKGTCRQFTLSFTNGETAHAYFEFKD